MDLIQIPRQQQLAILDRCPEDDFDYGHSGDEEPDEEPSDEEPNGDEPASAEDLASGEVSMEYPYPEPLLQDSQGQPEFFDPSPKSVDPPNDSQDVAPVSAPDSPKNSVPESPAPASGSMPPPAVPDHRLHGKREEILAKMASVRLGAFGVLAGSLAISSVPSKDDVIAINWGLKVTSLVLILG